MASLILNREPLALKNENVRDNPVIRGKRKASKCEPYS
jgi:hypothetical protein